jgi:hypothetical protein
MRLLNSPSKSICLGVVLAQLIYKQHTELGKNQEYDITDMPMKT